MTAILGSRGFRVEERENIYRIVEDLQAIPVSTRTFKLNHASAKELSDLFNQTYAPKDQAGRIKSPIASSFAGANVVVVTASDKIISDCESIIKAVDDAVAQVYIEARFIELSTEALHKLGMQWNSLESWGASVRNISAGIERNDGRMANYGTHITTRSSTQSKTTSSSSSANTSLSSGTSSSSASSSSSPSTSSSASTTYGTLVPSTIGAAAGAGRSAENMAWSRARGFSGQLSVDDFRLAMSAFEQLSDAKVFSNPKIIVSNGKEAKVDMTTKYPNVTIDSNYTGQNSQNLTISTKLDTIPGEDKFMFAKEAFFSWGIALSVVPRISPDGLISVEIVPTISDCTGYLTVNSSQETDTPYTQYPIIEVKRLTTEFTMKDGATAVIGGLSKTSEEDVDSGIPYLRKIPWIGQRIFGWKSRQKVQKEILVFVTVGIAHPDSLPKDVGLPKNAILGREFVRGTQLEPGDQDDVQANVLKLDTRPIDKREEGKEYERKEEAEKPKGTVKITPVETTKGKED
jgi:type II secretory pathway component GspD/PulD (secretin)